MPNTSTRSEHSSDRAFVRRVFIVVAIGAYRCHLGALRHPPPAVRLDPFRRHAACRCGTSGNPPAAPPPPGIGARRRAHGPDPYRRWHLPGSRARYPDAQPVHHPAGSLEPIAGLLQLGSMADLIKDGAAASALGGLASRIIAWSTTLAGALASLLLVLFGGIYLAISPLLYRDGLVKLVPPAVQPNMNATLDDSGEALKRWLAGQVIAMLLVGVFTGVGLWLAGVPSAFALGLIAGLAEFVPLIGPILAAIPSLLIASTQDWQTVLLALGVLVVVQQVESNLISPLIADRVVSIAPAVGLFAVVAMASRLGRSGCSWVSRLPSCSTWPSGGCMCATHWASVSRLWASPQNRHRTRNGFSLI